MSTDHAPREPRGRDQTEPRLRILVADDEYPQRRMFRRLLESHGYDTAAAASGRTVLSKAQAAQPDLILLDITMPDMNGIQVYKELKANARTVAIPVLLMTGVPYPQEMLDFTTLGLRTWRVYRKSTGNDALLRKIRRALDPGYKRRQNNGRSPLLRNGGRSHLLRRGPLKLDLSRQAVFFGGQSRRLGPGQLALLCALMRSKGPIMRQNLLDDIWDGSENRSTVNATVFRLREAIKGAEGVEIRAVPDGYELVVQDE